MGKKLTLVYLAHPFSDNPSANLARVEQIARKIVSLSACGTFSCFYAPFVPHLALAVFDEQSNPAIRSITEAVSVRAVGVCDELWIVSERLSPGMRLEVAAARAADIPIVEWSHLLSRIPGLDIVD